MFSLYLYFPETLGLNRVASSIKKILITLNTGLIITTVIALSCYSLIRWALFSLQRLVSMLPCPLR